MVKIFSSLLRHILGSFVAPSSTQRIRQMLGPCAEDLWEVGWPQGAAVRWAEDATGNEIDAQTQNYGRRLKRLAQNGSRV